MKSSAGIVIALVVIAAWTSCLVFLLTWEFSFRNPVTYLFILLQTHLYTGLFITAHDAMHGTVSSNRLVNNSIGQVCTALYAAFLFRGLHDNHHKHHRHVHSENDPDHHNGSFVGWYFSFMKTYISIVQLLIMAVAFNVLKIWVEERNLIMFWVLPSLLSTLQLFYFGTWLPHHGEHSNKHYSRSQPKNHVIAFLSCYFFGYHYEHHESPQIPWWQLWKTK